jgi:ligand-binding sensor domain-containing protein/serine phosphatase RsbU (regulator of sigma subunit)
VFQNINTALELRKSKQHLMKKRRTYSCILFLFILCLSGRAQSLSFRHYDKGEGLNNGFIYTIHQGFRGFVWIATGNGFLRFDGLHFSSSKSAGKGITLVTASYRDKNNDIWIGHDNGQLSHYNGYYFTNLTQNKSLGSDIRSICEINGEIFAFAQNGRYVTMNKSGISRMFEEYKDKLTILCVQPVKENLILMGTDAGLYLYQIDRTSMKLSEITKYSQIPPSNISFISKSAEKDAYWVATKDEGFFLLLLNFEKPALSVADMLTQKFKIDMWNIESIYEDSSHNLWVGTNDMGLYAFIFSNEEQEYKRYIHYNTENGFSSTAVRCIFEDRDKNIWVGTFGDGLYVFFRNAIQLLPIKNYGLGQEIYSVSVTANSVLMGCNSGFITLTNDLEITKIHNLSGKIPGIDITAIDKDSRGNIWLGTKRNGLFSYNPENGKLEGVYFSQNTLENFVNAIIIDSNYIWIATNGGVVKYNSNNHTSEIFSTNTAQLPHNKINFILKDSKGHIWIATKSNTLVSLNSETKYQLGGNINIEFTSLAEDKQGALWATTAGYGVFMFKKDSMMNYTVDAGLLSDYSYSIRSDLAGNIWVGHRQGISKIMPVQNKIITFGLESGINGDCNPNAIAVGNNKIVFGMTNGLASFDFKKMTEQSNTIVPEIVSIKVSDKEVDESKPVILSYGKYSFRFEFVGLNYAQPNAVRYQYKMDGWDLKWSDVTRDNWALYPRLDDGKYAFLVRSFSPAGTMSEKELSIDIEIKKPFWKKWWFQVLIISLFISLVLIIVMIREKRQVAFQKYLKKLLDERTAEVVNQKQELEHKNKDITDSINYARRIQSSMLPSIDRLSQYFSQCFIIYYPRDIVSGDFYWFSQIENKVLLLCADSTGHGVPGAFMSLIGITLMKDICASNPAYTPAMLLDRLDIELQNTINQNQLADKSSDGMDASLLELDLTTFQIRLSSAMRPVVLFHKGEQHIIEGSKSTIGSTPSLKMKKEFSEHSMKLSKGDTLYLFTDGITDQFGGPTNKKFKVNKLRTLLNEIHNKPMVEQKEIIEEIFRIWKGDHDQLDDVLMIGLRL